MTMTPPTKVVRLTDSQWNEQKEMLRKLYLVENRTTAEVQLIMLEKHKFLASIQQYERIFKKWSFQKNYKQEYWASLIAMIEDGKLDPSSNQLKSARVKRALVRHKTKRDITPQQHRSAAFMATAVVESTTQPEQILYRQQDTTSVPSFDDVQCAARAGQHLLQGYPTLLLSALLGSTDVVRQLLKSRVHFNVLGPAALCRRYSIQRPNNASDNANAMQNIREDLLRPDAKPCFISPLAAAAARGHQTIISELLKAGADPNFCTLPNGMTPLQAAVIFQQRGAVKYLLSLAKDTIDPTCASSGISPSCATISPFFLALASGDREMVVAIHESLTSIGPIILSTAIPSPGELRIAQKYASDDDNLIHLLNPWITAGIFEVTELKHLLEPQIL